MARTVVTYNAGTWDVAGVAPTTLPITAPVTSVFGRTGAIVATTNDYTEAQLSFSDITTNNVSTTQHGFAPKAPNDATKFLDGTGAYSTPAGGPPSGAAGGALDGTYPNPGLANSVAGTGLTEAADVLSVNYGTTGTTACVGNDARLSDSRAPNGAAGGALAGTYPNPTLASTNLYASELVVATDATVAASTGVVIPGQLTINDGINLTISDTGRVMLL